MIVLSLTAQQDPITLRAELARIKQAAQAFKLLTPDQLVELDSLLAQEDQIDTTINGAFDFRPEEAFNSYWIEQILSSPDYANMRAAGHVQGMATKEPRLGFQVELARAGIDWQVFIWQMPDPNLDQHHYTIGLTDNGLVAIFTGRGMQDRAKVMTWPGKAHIATLYKNDKPLKVPGLNAFVTDHQRLSDTETKLAPVLRSHAMAAACLISPRRAYRVYRGLGGQGVCDSVLFGPLRNIAIGVGALAFSTVMFDLPNDTARLFMGDGSPLQLSLWGSQLVLSFILLLYTIAYIPVATGLLYGTWERAKGRAPLKAELPLKQTGHSNALLRLLEGRGKPR